MSEPQNPSSSSSVMKLEPDIFISDSDGRFFHSLYDFIEHEKRYLRCPDIGPDELRYIIYRSAFNKVIAQSTAYRRLLSTIKGEYDDFIRELKRRQDDTRTTQRSLTALKLHQKSLITCHRRATQLRDRISALHGETAELQEEINRHRSLREQSTWIPGLTVAESEHAEALDEHLKLLEVQRAALLGTKSNCVSLEVKADLDAELQAAETHRDQLSTDNVRLTILHKRLRFVSDRLSSWEEEGQQVPLEKLLGSTLQNISQIMTDDDRYYIDSELFEDEEPSGVDQSRFLTDYLHRFSKLCDSAQYEEAALLAARSPRGVLRNLDIMEIFKGVSGPSGPVPPVLFFSQALLMTAPAGDALSAPLSLQVVGCALHHGASRLVTHAVAQNKLTFSEELGHILTNHAQNNPGVATLCLTLATTIYEACGLNRKTALSMCSRGLIHSAAEFMNHCKNVTAEDRLWVLRRSPSLTLLRLWTTPEQGRAAVLSAGEACSSLLAEPQQQDLALQLLDTFISREILEVVILEDQTCSADTWTHVSSLCSRLSRADLSRAVLSILLHHGRCRALSPELDGARLMEHVFL